MEVVPAEIVGTWETSDGDATLVYRFLPDGRYRFAAVLTQPVPEGTFEIIRAESGTVTVDRDVIILSPDMVTTTRRDPADPEGDYTDRPEPLVPQRLSWRVEHGVLLLVDSAGLELSFDRQPE